MRSRAIQNETLGFNWKNEERRIENEDSWKTQECVLQFLIPNSSLFILHSNQPASLYVFRGAGLGAVCE